MSTFRICPHGEPERSCPLCGLDEPRPEGLYQFLPASGRLFTVPTDPLANAIAAMRYIRERSGQPDD